MYWNKSFTSLEYWFIAVFAIIYLAYIARVIYISMRLKVSARATFLKIIPRTLAFSLLIIALLEPTFGFVNDDQKAGASSRNIMVLLDVSHSMSANDLNPSRLLVAKNEIKKLIKKFDTDKLGLVTFATEAQLLMPLTKDLANLENVLSNITTLRQYSGGTNLNEALQMATLKLRQSRTFDNTANTIVLLTDGEDFSDITDVTFNDIQRYRIKLVAVGLGTTAGAVLKDTDGKTMLSPNKQPVRSHIEAEYLQSLSNKCDGKYFEINNKQSSTTEILDYITQLKGFSGNFEYDAANPGNKYQYPLLLALLLIVFDFVFTFRIFDL